MQRQTARKRKPTQTPRDVTRPGGRTPAAIDALQRAPVEVLPDYPTGKSEHHLRMVKTLLWFNGFRVIYADLTRQALAGC